MGGFCPKAQLCLRSPAIPWGCYERGTTSAGLTSTHERRCRVGSESGLTLGGRSTSCTRWRLLDSTVARIASAARPARLVVRAALRVRQDLAGLEMGEQVHEAHLGARALDLGRCRAHRR